VGIAKPQYKYPLQFFTITETVAIYLRIMIDAQKSQQTQVVLHDMKKINFTLFSTTGISAGRIQRSRCCRQEVGNTGRIQFDDSDGTVNNN